MSLINTSTKTLVWINGTDVSEYIISGSVSDESTLASSIISTTGSIELAGSSNRALILDYDRVNFPIGSRIDIWCTLPNGNVAKHPRGALYVLNSKVNIQAQTLELEVGCSLAMLKQYEDLYPSAVKLLYFLTKDYNGYFEIEDYSLSNLAGILDTMGDLIYQDAYGNVQLITGFSDNSAFIADAPKATFFDKFTSINVETIENAITAPERIDVFANIDIISKEDPAEEAELDAIESDSGDNEYPEEGFGGAVDPISGEEGNEDTGSTEEENTEDVGKPPTTTTTETRKQSRRVKGTFSQNLFVGKTQTSQGRTLPPNCGSAVNPDPPTANEGGEYKWDIQFEATLESGDELFEEVVVSSNTTYYNAPGNLENVSISYEQSSHWSVSSSNISAWLSSAANAVGQAVSNANNFTGIANENLNNRDQKKLEIKKGKKKEDNGSVTYVPWTAVELAQLENAEQYYDCVAQHAVRNADYWIYVARGIGNSASGIVSNVGTDATTTSKTETYKWYGSGGELREEISYTYKPWVTSPKAQEDLQWNLDDVTHSTEGVALPALRYDLKLVLAEKTTTTYEYFPSYTKQTTKREDLFDPVNNETRVEISSGNNKNPEEANRLQEDNTLLANVTTVDQGGLLTPEEKDEFDEYAKEELNATDEEYEDLLTEIDTTIDYCDVTTESKELKASSFRPVSIAITNPSWLGAVTPTTERLDISATFRRIVPYKDGLGNCILGSGNSVGTYLSIMQKYASIQLKKRHADNRGIRVTEKMRSEIFGYYPFYPFDVSLSVIGKAFKCRASAATWAFDSTNAVCSFDAYILAETLDAVFDEGDPGFVNPFSYINDVFPYLQTEAYVPLASDAGNFDTGTSDDGASADGGEFTLNTTENGSSLNSGDFDTGDSIPFEPPVIPPGAPTGLGSADPETDYGSDLLDSSGSVIGVETLPALGTELDTLVNIGIEVNIALPFVYSFNWNLYPFPGYNYGKITWKTGFPLNMGTITVPNTDTFNFGTITAPVDPVVDSYIAG